MTGTVTSVGGALAHARERFIAKNPFSQAAYRDALRAMPGGSTRSSVFYTPFPLTMSGGEGCMLTDLDGHSYVDLLGEYTAGLYGHNSPVIRKALDAALDRGWNLGPTDALKHYSPGCYATVSPLWSWSVSPTQEPNRTCSRWPPR